MNQVNNFTKGLLKTLVHGTMSGLGMQIGHAVYDRLKEVYPHLKAEVYPAVRDRVTGLTARFQSKVNTETKTNSDSAN